MSAGSKLTVFFLALILGGRALSAEKKGPTPQTQRAIREAENLSLLKDRLQACTALIRAIKKTTVPNEVHMLNEKLSQLSKYFYTDKGFQDYLLGKDFFEKQKFNDALEKLSEADDLEKGNVDVLHYLELSQLWLKKTPLAEATNKKAMQINPFDIEILRDQLAIFINIENWEEALASSQNLKRDYSDQTALTQYFFALAQLKGGAQIDGEKSMTEVMAKDSSLPEPYFWLGSTESPPKEVTRLMSKYFELCNMKALRFFERDPLSCSHLEEAKKVATSLPAPITKSSTQKKESQ